MITTHSLKKKVVIFTVNTNTLLVPKSTTFLVSAGSKMMVSTFHYLLKLAKSTNLVVTKYYLGSAVTNTTEI